MKLRYIIPATVLASFLVAGVASAQTSVTTTTTPATGAISSGTAVNLGSISMVGPFGSVVTSLPIAITAGGSASNSQLSSCQLYNSAGASVTTGVNVVNVIGSGSSVFTLNTPLGINANPLVLTLRCNVAAGVPAGATFTLNSVTPNVNARGPFVANLDIAPSVPVGSQDVTLSNISLGTGAATSVRISSIPLSITAGNGASVSQLSDCQLRNTSNLFGSLSGSINPVGGTVVFNLTTPFTIPAGSAEMFGLTCDVSSTTPVGGTFTIAITPSGIAAVDATTGASITAAAVTGVGPNGLLPATSGTIIVTSAVTGVPPVIPGVPNTGAGGSAQTALILALSALIALAGATYIRYQVR